MSTFEVGERVAVEGGPLRHLSPNTGTVIPWDDPADAKPGKVRVHLDATGGAQSISAARLYSAEDDD